MLTKTKARKFGSVMVTLSLILFTYNTWEDYQKIYADTIRQVEISAVEKLRSCRDPRHGYSIYECENCGRRKYIPFSCKSRICSSCGSRMVKEWSERIYNKLLDVWHRHIVLTIPDKFWKMVARNPAYIKALLEAGKVTMEDMIRFSSRKKKRLRIGLIQVVQTYGADMKCNVHLHGIVTEGGFDRRGNWVNVSFIDYNKWRKKWQYEVLTRLKKEMPKNRETNMFIDSLFKEHKKGFVIYGKRRFHKSEAMKVVRYVGRYVRHPPIAESRIISYGREKVRFWYRESGSKKKVIVTLGKFEFIRRLLSHVPEKNFKIARCYGIYSRKSKTQIQMEFSMDVRGEDMRIEDFSWRAWLIRSFNIDPLICNECNGRMYFVGIQINKEEIDNLDKPPPYKEVLGDTQRKSQEEKVKIILSTIRGNTKGRGAELEKVIEEVVEEGIEESDLLVIVKHLKECGEVYEPARGIVATTY